MTVIELIRISEVQQKDLSNKISKSRSQIIETKFYTKVKIWFSNQREVYRGSPDHVHLVQSMRSVLFIFVFTDLF